MSKSLIVKRGKTKDGRQIYYNTQTNKRFMLDYQRGRSEIKAIAVTLYLRGLSFRKVSEILGVSHVSVSRWFKELVETVDNQIIIKKDNKIYKNLEIDELFTFEKKKVKKLISTL